MTKETTKVNLLETLKSIYKKSDFDVPMCEACFVNNATLFADEKYDNNTFGVCQTCWEKLIQ